MAWLLVGSIPGVLIGSQHRRSACPSAGCGRVRLRADPLGDQGRRRAAGDVRDRGRARPRRARARWSGASGALRRVAAEVAGRQPAQPGVESAAAWPGSSRPRSSWRCSRRLPARSRSPSGAKLELSPIYGTRRRPRSFSPGVQLRHGGREHRLPAAEARAAHRLDGARRRARARRSSRAARIAARPGAARVRRHRRRRGSRSPTASTGRSSTSRSEHRTIELPERDPARHEAARRCASGTASTRTSRPTATAATTSSASATGSSEPAHAILLVDGRQVVLHARPRAQGVLALERQDRRPRRARPATTCSRIAARGRRRQPREAVPVRGRPGALRRARPRRACSRRPAARFAILALTDAPQVDAGASTARSGVARPRDAALQAPRKPGVYRLYVSAGGHAAKALVVVA